MALVRLNLYSERLTDAAMSERIKPPGYSTWMANHDRTNDGVVQVNDHPSPPPCAGE